MTATPVSDNHCRPLSYDLAVSHRRFSGRGMRFPNASTVVEGNRGQRECGDRHK